jgi:MinD superfamily P-loop ATPase
VGKSYTYTGNKSKKTCNCVVRKKSLIQFLWGRHPACPDGLEAHHTIEEVREIQHLIKVLPANQMIELVSESRCIQCNLCVKVCPTNVFDQVPNAPPRIARQSDCQTCFMCELYCPVDALYVAPEVEPLTEINEQSLTESQLLGSYRKNIGWGKSLITTVKEDSTYQLLKKMK